MVIARKDLSWTRPSATLALLDLIAPTASFSLAKAHVHWVRSSLASVQPDLKAMLRSVSRVLQDTSAAMGWPQSVDSPAQMDRRSKLSVLKAPLLMHSASLVALVFSVPMEARLRAGLLANPVLSWKGSVLRDPVLTLRLALRRPRDRMQ